MRLIFVMDPLAVAVSGRPPVQAARRSVSGAAADARQWTCPWRHEGRAAHASSIPINRPRCAKGC